MDWDDLRFVLAVWRTGSTLGAARALGVNQSTVMRRVAHLESTLGVELFERKQSGYRPTAQGQCVAEAAERLDAQIRELENAIAVVRRSLAGTIRLTTSESIANRLVPACLQAFHKLHPGVRVDLIADDRRLDLARGEADIALRGGSRPEGTGIVMRRLPDAGWTVYCSKGYAAEHGVPASRAQIAGHMILGMEGMLAELPGPRWIAAAAPAAEIPFRCNSLTNVVSSLRAGLGLAALPCFVGDAEADLMRCFPPPPELNSEMWLVLREDLRSVPHIRAFADFATGYMQSIRELLAGLGP